MSGSRAIAGLMAFIFIFALSAPAFASPSGQAIGTSVPGWYRQDTTRLPGDSGDPAFFTDLAVVDENTAWACGNYGLVCKTTDGGRHWSKQHTGSENFYIITAADRNTAWAYDPFTRYLYKTTNGSTWKYFRDMGDLQLDPTDLDAASRGVIWGVGGFDAFVSADGGSTWSHKNFDDRTLQAVSAVDATTAWAVGHFIYGGGAIMKTTNRGANWTALRVRGRSEYKSVCAVDEDNVWAVGWGSIMRTSAGSSSDWTSTWKEQYYHQNANLVLGNEITAVDGRRAWVAGFGSWVWRTEDGGSTWFFQPALPDGNSGDNASGYTPIDQKVGDIDTLYAIGAANAERIWAVGSFDNNEQKGAFRYKPAVLSTDDGGGSRCDVWYLPEGSTAWGFQTYLTVINPGSGGETVVRFTFMPSKGDVVVKRFKLAFHDQAVLDNDYLKSILGEADFSTKVESENGGPIAVDRTMTWTGPGAASSESHCSVGVTAPSTHWYFPEGSSRWGFESWLLVQNPNSKTANCQITYMIENEGPVTVQEQVPANTRKTFSMAQHIGSKDASIEVTSDIPVIPERAMYRNNRREGHDSVGTTKPSSSFYLAEGTTGWGFTTYVLVQNPNDEPTDVTVTYMTASGPVEQPAFQMPPNSRKTIRVNDVLPNTDLSTRVAGTRPIIAERAMYWDSGTGEACHDSIGIDSPHAAFMLPDGQIGRCETYILVQNPNDSDVLVDLQLEAKSTGGNQGQVNLSETIPANSRRTFNLYELLARAGTSEYLDPTIYPRWGTSVSSLSTGLNVIVERSMYWNSRGAGTDTIGGYVD